MKIQEIAETIFGDEVTDYVVFDASEERVVTSNTDEDALLLSMPDSELDLSSDGECYAVVSDEIPLDQAGLIAEKDDRRLGIFFLEDPIDIDSIPDFFDVSTPVGVGWKYAYGVDVFHTLDDLIEARVSANADDVENVDCTVSVSDSPVDEGSGGTPPSEKAAGAEESEVTYMNDAELLGVSTPDMQELLQRDATFMLGNLYGQRDRRNTQDGDWKAVTMPWLAWLHGQDKGKNSWGLSRHPENKTKEGASIVLAEAIDGARTDSAIQTMYAVGLDIDSGAKLDDVLDRLEELGLFAIVYTSHSHGKDRLILKHDDIMRKMKLDESPNRVEIQQYLREHHKDRFDEDYIQSIEIEELRHQTKDGLRTILKTRPLDKFRVILPLWEPVKLADLGATVNQWKEVWADAVTGVGVNMLGVSFDVTCSDVNRLFFTPRHPPGAEWYSAIVQGRPLRFEEIEPYSKARYVKERDPGDPFAAGADLGAGERRRERFSTPNGKDMNDWHRTHKERFLITDVLESFCDDKIRVAGGERAGTTHLECPFEHEHSTEGGTATMAMNPDENDAGYWTVFCRHDACQGRDKLEFVKEMLEQGWFEEEVIWDEEWNLPLPDEDLPDEPDSDEDEEPQTPEQQAEKFTTDATEQDVFKFLKKHAKIGVDKVTKNRLTKILARQTDLTVRDIGAIWRDVSAELNRLAAERDDSPKNIIPETDWDFEDRMKWARERIAEVNAKNPRLFHYIEDVARVTEDSKGRPIIKILSEKGFGSMLNEFMVWHEVRTVGDMERRRGVATPRDVVENIYHGEHPYPCLRGLVSTPTFVEGGELLTVPGFHSGSGLYYWNENNLDVPPVSDVPTEEEVFESKRILIEEVFGDFPLGGLTREEMVQKALYSDEGVPAVTHLMSALLLMFCRDLIDGATPGHLVTKPNPGTGASLLAETLSMIAYGKPVPAQHLPTTNEEMQKTLLTVIRNGDNIIYFDNIDKSVDSGVFASYLTAREVSGRVLGKTQSVTAEVRAIWLLCGNNVRLSKELLRRLLMIDMDANMANPEKRSGFRHKNLARYVMENRGKLVWACLTIIQNWVAKGMNIQEDVVLNSFEEWSYVMGGILRDAKLGGFLSNLEELQERASDGSDDDIVQFLDSWWERYSNKPVLARSSDPEEESLIRMAVEQDAQLPLRMKRNADDEMTYDPRQFNNFLGTYEGRVMVLTDGTEVKITKTSKRAKGGHRWKLDAMHNTSG